MQWLGIAAAAIGCILLGGASILGNFADHQRHRQGIAELERFVVLLDAVNAVSAERGPSNSAMGASDAEASELRAALETKRAQTNLALDAVALRFDGDLERNDGVNALTVLRESLAAGRAKVDIAIMTPSENRQALIIGEAIMAMFAAADRAGELRDLIGGHIIEETPQLAGEVFLANSASAVRD
ncbi:hypothetical protein VW35_05775 [Devosia soli]|uniref:Uncharacterized protein n=1 Tax=Devosia soli TaxID=361041 RepID=A0A0F5LEE1_9HYPH|nr:hypothetical protein VW35_05775 [Devosia soli]